MSDYTNLTRPYDAVMNRTPGGTSPVITNTNDLFNQPAAASSATLQASAPSEPSLGAIPSFTGTETPMGSVATNQVSSQQSLSNTYISTFLRSVGWKPNARGFNIDGASGDAQFATVTLNESVIAN